MSTHPLETKDIQESLLGISDFFESVELVPHNAQVSDSARVLLTTIPRRGRFPGPYHESALSNLCLAVYLSCAVLEKVKLRQVDAVTP